MFSVHILSVYIWIWFGRPLSALLTLFMLPNDHGSCFLYHPNNILGWFIYLSLSSTKNISTFLTWNVNWFKQLSQFLAVCCDLNEE